MKPHTHSHSHNPHKTAGEKKTVIHWGQRKLLLSEIEFLTWHAFHGCAVVYAGAAPGTHIPYLCKLFPWVQKWILYDPTPFHPATKRHPKVECVEDIFTDDV